MANNLFLISKKIKIKKKTSTGQDTKELSKSIDLYSPNHKNLFLELIFKLYFWKIFVTFARILFTPLLALSASQVVVKSRSIHPELTQFSKTVLNVSLRETPKFRQSFEQRRFHCVFTAFSQNFHTKKLGLTFIWLKYDWLKCAIVSNIMVTWIWINMHISIFQTRKINAYIWNQGELNKKEIQLNLCKIFTIFIFNELYLFI